MKRLVAICFLIFASCLFFYCDRSNKDVKDKGSKMKYVFLKQSKKQRIFLRNSLVLKKEIKFGDLKEEIYSPIEIEFDSKKDIYIFDGKTGKIHKIEFGKDFSDYNDFVFLNRSLKGKGPGEVSRLLDFKVYNHRVYLLDGGANSLIIYSDNGRLIKHIKVQTRGDVLLFSKFTFLNNKPLLCVYSSKKLFYQIDESGKILKSFGKYIDKSYPDNVLYHQYSVSKPIESDGFYYMPLYLGFVGFYKGNNLEFVKETMDGRRFPRFLKEEIGGAIVTRLKGARFMTVSAYATTKKLILIKSVNMKSEEVYWDFYKIKDFDYMFSIKNPPPSYDFDTIDNYLVISSEDSLKIFDISSIVKRF